MFGQVSSVFALLALFVAAGDGFSTGAPAEVCGDMTPKHLGSPLNSPAPYSVAVSSRQVNAGDVVTITITAKGKDNFKGFMVQGRVGEEPVGSFEKSAGVQTVDCGNGLQTAATHTDSMDKKTIVLKWKAPKGLTEIVRFRTTIVQNGKTCWVGVPSPRVTVGRPKAAAATSTGRRQQ